MIFVYFLIVTFVTLFYLTNIIIRENFISHYNLHFKNNKREPLKYIPKKIFQIINNKDNINIKFLENINYLKSLNPDWKYYLFDDEDIITYIKNNFPSVILEYYNKINPNYGPAKYDFFRYLLIYNEGGVYLDIKSAIKYPLSEVILPEDEYILSNWGKKLQKEYVDHPRGEYQQWHIISRPRHPFLHAVIDKVMENIDNYDETEIGTGKIAVLKTTGPIVYTNVIYPIEDLYNHRYVEVDELLGLIYNNVGTDYKNLYTKKHYSMLTEPLIKNV